MGQPSQPAGAQSPSQVLTPPPLRAGLSGRWPALCPGSDKGACEVGGHPPPLQNEPCSLESETLRPEAGPEQICSRGGVRPAPGSGAGAGTNVGQLEATGCAFVQDPLPERPGVWGLWF